MSRRCAKINTVAKKGSKSRNKKDETDTIFYYCLRTYVCAKVFILTSSFPTYTPTATFNLALIGKAAPKIDSNHDFFETQYSLLHVIGDEKQSLPLDSSKT